VELTIRQNEGLKVAIQRYSNFEHYTVIAGYAGTGKSTLVKFIIEALNVDEDRVCYAAYTGKAAEVLRKKGNKNVSTLHRLLYDHIPKPTGGFLRKRKLKIDYDVVVVDEISMVPKDMAELLFSHHCYIICLGDPFQLPPIDKNSDNHLLDHPHIFLDEIMRQEADSEIINLTMKIRHQEPIDFYEGKEVKILKKADLNLGMLTWADQILVATNATRHKINKQMRTIYNRTGDLPVEGDKVICCRNYWEDISKNGDALVNGTLGYLRNPYGSFIQLPSWCGSKVSQIDTVQAEFISEDGADYGCKNIDANMLLTGEPTLDWKIKYKLGKNVEYQHYVPKEFEYGYAITVHRAQGSEWDNVLVIEESFPFDKIEHARWLYTAATRASEKLVLIR